MSEERARSAIDAIVDQNISLRDEIDDLVTERDDAERRAAEAMDSTRRSTKGGKVKIGFVGEDVSASDDDSEQHDAGEPGAIDPSAATDAGVELAELIAERDAYLADSQRLAADFANYRKQSDKRVADTAAAQSAGLVRDLLPVLDACDSAIEHNPDSPVAAIRQALLGELERNGLELLAPEIDEPFEPEKHDAVMHEAADDAEAGDGGATGPRIGEVLRAGYVWKGRVVRPAMVKVVG